MVMQLIILIPRATDRASGRWLLVSNKTNDTFDINVGANCIWRNTCLCQCNIKWFKKTDWNITVNVGTSSNVTNHTFVSATDAIGYSPFSTDYSYICKCIYWCYYSSTICCSYIQENGCKFCICICCRSCTIMC